VNGQILFWSLPTPTWAPLVTAMKDHGIQIVRADAPWQNIEPDGPSGAHHSYRWQQLDVIVSALAANGLRWLPVIGYSAPWAASRRVANGAPDFFSAPARSSDFAQYAAAVVARYGPRGSFWRIRTDLPAMPVNAVEIWNEENTTDFWQPAPDPGAYLRLYEAARTAVHGVASKVEVIVGGLGNPASDFLNGMYAAGGNRPGLFDAVAIHPYDDTAEHVLADVRSTRQTLDAHGDIDTPLNVTEVGWPTLGVRRSGGGLPNVTDVLRASYLSNVASTLATSDCAVERIFPHTWVTRERDLVNQEDWYGLVHPGGGLTATAAAYGDVIAKLQQAAPANRASLAMCNRPLSVAAGSARSKRRPPASVPAHSACALATATSGGSLVDGASVTFTFTPDPGFTAAAVPTVRAVTNARGHAVGCVRAAPGSTGTIQITATRVDFSTMPSAERRVRVR
jgi:hypothetical protein